MGLRDGDGKYIHEAVGIYDREVVLAARHNWTLTQIAQQDPIFIEELEAYDLAAIEYQQRQQKQQQRKVRNRGESG